MDFSYTDDSTAVISHHFHLQKSGNWFGLLVTRECDRHDPYSRFIGCILGFVFSDELPDRSRGDVGLVAFAVDGNHDDLVVRF